MSVNGLQQQYIPPTLDGLNVIDADQIYIDGELVDLDNLVPYTGATKILDMGSLPVRSSAVPTTGNDLINFTELVNAITNQDITNSTTFLNKITATAQTVVGQVSFDSAISSASSVTTPNYYAQNSYIWTRPNPSSYELSISRVSDGSNLKNMRLRDDTSGVDMALFASTGQTIYTGLACDYATASKVPIFDANKNLVSSGVDASKIDYLDNVSSDIQTQLNARLLKAGDTMTGTLDMGANKVTTTYTPVDNVDLIPKGYADSTYVTSSALTNYLPLTGGTLTGNLSSTTGTLVNFGEALKTVATDQGYSGASFTVSTAEVPAGVQTGTLSGTFRLTALSGFAVMAMAIANLNATYKPNEYYTFTFTGMSGSVPLTLTVFQNITPRVTVSITTSPQTITRTFTTGTGSGKIYFNFQALSANPYVDWTGFTMTRTDTQVNGLLDAEGSATIAGNVSIGDGTQPVANSAGITTLFNTGNICTNRNRLIFSNGATDWNHCIYNNYRNLDNEGIFDGMKMNVYLGLQVRVGNANAVVPTTALSIDSAGRVGIGITNPGSVLDVVSTTAQYNTSLRVRTDWAGIQLASSGSGGRTYNLLSSITGAGIGGGGFGIFDETSNAYRLYVVSNGFVGIGAATSGFFVGANCKLTVNADYNVGDTGGFCINATDGPNANFYNLRIFPYVQGGGLVAYQFRTYNQAIAYDSFKIAAGGDVFFDKKVNIGVASDGMINIRNPNGSVTHFGWTDNWNYIRGVATQIDTSYVYANSIFNIYSGTRYAVLQGFMAQGSLTLGGIDRNYGGGSGWNANTAGLLFECLTQTEIAVHDAGQRLASLMYFVGDAANTITIGRDMGWGTTQVLVPSSLSCGGYFQVGTGNAWMKMGVKGGTISGDIYTTANWPQNHNAMLISQDANQGPNTSGMCLGYGTLNSQTGVITCLGPSVAWRNLYISAADTYVLRNGVTVAYTQAGGWVNISDEREKEDIQDLKTSSSLKRVLALKPKHYRRKYYETGTPVPEETKHQRIIGFCAQEVKESNPHCVSEWENDQVKCEEDDGKRMGICYNDYVVHLVGAVQEQQKIIEAQRQEFAEYKRVTEERFDKIAQLLSTLK